jgi:hypothetical protein
MQSVEAMPQKTLIQLQELKSCLPTLASEHWKTF